jgi:hypothetical protein
MTHEALRPFEPRVRDDELADQRQRLGRTRWPDQLARARPWKYGTVLQHLRTTRADYQWRPSAYPEPTAVP